MRQIGHFVGGKEVPGSSGRFGDVFGIIYADSVHSGAPLSTVERWLGLPGGRRLVDTILVVENFPVLVRDREQDAGLRIVDADVRVVEDLPLVAEARPAERLRLRVRYDAARVAPASASAALAGWRAALVALPAAGTVGDLLAAAGGAVAAEAAGAAARRRDRAADLLAATRRRPAGGSAS